MIDRRGLATGLVALGIAGQARAQAGEGTLDRVRRTKTVRVGVVGAQPPYSWKDASSGAWTGFLVDCARDLAAGLGAGIEPVESSWGNAVLDVQSGKVDVFFGLAPTAQRALAVDFTRPLYDNAFALIARTGFDPARWSDLDTPSARVALELGTVYDQAVPVLCPQATVTRARSNNDALLMVQAGRADCQMLVVILALTTLARNPGLGHLIVPEPLHNSATAAMVAKAPDPVWRTTVDDWVARRRSSGDLRKMLVANLVKVGVPEQSVPPQLLF